MPLRFLNLYSCHQSDLFKPWSFKDTSLTSRCQHQAEKFYLEIEVQQSTRAICIVSRKSILVGGFYCRLNSIKEMKRALYSMKLELQKKTWVSPILLSLTTSMQSIQAGATEAKLKGPFWTNSYYKKTSKLLRMGSHIYMHRWKKRYRLG